MKEEEVNKNEEDEKDLPCPSYTFLKRAADGTLQLEIPIQYSDDFMPITTKTYNCWLEEKSKDPEALKELEEDEEDEVDVRKEED